MTYRQFSKYSSGLDELLRAEGIYNKYVTLQGHLWWWGNGDFIQRANKLLDINEDFVKAASEVLDEVE